LVGLWLNHILEPNISLQYYDETPMPFYGKLLSLQEFGKYAYLGILFFWISLNTFLFIRLNSVHRLLEKGTSIYIFIYLLLSASFEIYQQGNPLQPALTFVLLGILYIFKMYKNERGLRPVYEAGFCFGLASLFYANAIFLGIFVFASLFILVPLNWRQWMSGILGLLSPIAVIIAWYFINDSLPSFLKTVENNIVIWHKHAPVHYTQYILFGLLTIIVISSILSSYTNILKKVSSKKYYSLFLFMILLVGAMYFAIPAAGTEIFFFIIPAIVFYITNYLIHLRSRFFQEVIFSLLIISIVLIELLA